MINILGSYCRRRLQMIPIAKMFCRSYIKVSEKLEITFKQLDNIPRNFQLIYRYPSYKVAGLMFHAVNFCAVTTLGTTAYAWFIDNSIIINDDTPKFITSPMQTIIVSFGIVLVVLLSWSMRRRSPMRVYLQPKSNNYRAVFLGRIPFTTEFIEFKKGAVSYVSPNSSLPWRSSLLQANGRKMLLYDDYFKTGGDLYDMFKSNDNK